jgi:hypothetical protein
MQIIHFLKGEHLEKNINRNCACGYCPVRLRRARADGRRYPADRCSANR